MNSSSDRRRAAHLIDDIADGLGINIYTWTLEPKDGGPDEYSLVAVHDTTGERWMVQSDSLLTAAVELAEQVGFRPGS